MFGWFKTAVVEDFNDYAARLEVPPCGNNRVHYYWCPDNEERRSCPACSANIIRRKELGDIDILAKRIAEQLKSSDNISCVDHIIKVLCDHNCCLTTENGHIVIKDNVTQETSKL